MNTMAGCASTTPKEKEEKTEISKEEKSETDAETVKVTSVFGEDEVELEYPEVPERVVSMAGFATEMLLALGLEDHIVGYAWQDNEVLPQYQEAFEKLEPLCPPAMDPGEEKVLAAEPDLVLSWASWSDEEYFNYKNEKWYQRLWIPFRTVVRRSSGRCLHGFPEYRKDFQSGG